jgi:hypothetical protein
LSVITHTSLPEVDRSRPPVIKLEFSHEFFTRTGALVQSDESKPHAIYSMQKKKVVAMHLSPVTRPRGGKPDPRDQCYNADVGTANFAGAPSALYEAKYKHSH